MKNGFGSPQVRIFTSSAEVSANVVDFSYKYSQEEDDVCQIRIRDKNVDLADRPEFQDGAILKVVWGYTGEDKKIRKVCVRSIKASFTETEICLDLLCTDLSSRIKGNSSKKIHKGTLLQIGSEIAKKNGLKLVSTSIDDSGNIYTEGFKNTDNRRPGYYKEDSNYTTAIDNTGVSRDMKFRVYDQLPQANMSDFNILKAAAKGDPSGPFEVTGRDDQLIIQKKDLNQKPLKVFDYKDGKGLVLSFYPESKDYTRKKSYLNINTIAFNPEDKLAYDINTNDFTNSLTKLGEVSEVSPRVSGDPIISDDATSTKPIKTGPGGKEDEVYDLKSFFPWAGEKSPKKPEKVTNINPPTDKSKIPDNSEVIPSELIKKEDADNTNNSYALKKDYGTIHFGVIDNNSPSIVNPFNQIQTTPIATTSVVKFVPQPLDYTQHLPSSEHSLEEAYAKANNEQSNSSLSKNPAELKVVGDKDLISGRIISIINVSKKYSGNYYIEECIHRITPGMIYEVSMKLSKNAHGKIPGDTPTKIPINSLDINNRIKDISNVNKEVVNNTSLNTNKQLSEISANKDNIAYTVGAKW